MTYKLLTLLALNLSLFLVWKICLGEVVVPKQKKNIQIQNCSGSWPDPTWKENDFKLKNKALEECRKKLGVENEGKTWE